jgi:hypothetical protein
VALTSVYGLYAAGRAHASGFTVDRNDVPERSTANACTAAVRADAINVPAGTYTMRRDGANENADSTGDLDVKDDLTITGAGALATRVLHTPLNSAPQERRNHPRTASKKASGSCTCAKLLLFSKTANSEFGMPSCIIFD